MSRRKGTLYACLGLQLANHERAIDAGEAAMGVYSFLILFSRERELDGFVPTAAAERCWTGDRKANRQRLKSLERAGLICAAQDGWTVINYSDFNETRKEIAVRRGTDRTRKRAEREEITFPVQPDSERTSTIVPAYGSASVSGSDLDRKRDPESQADPAKLALAPGSLGESENAWLAGVADGTGRRPPGLLPLDRGVAEDLYRQVGAGMGAADAITAFRAFACRYAQHEIDDHGGANGMSLRRAGEWWAVKEPRGRPTALARGRPVQPYTEGDIRIPEEMP